ncbi:MAG: MarR family transcriptional regulator [Microthrixaceae bacterium]|nr:MarR family transcriptional regulator [Microthrixaceae bacterium]MCO5313246.1 MarR family transcriptional regulator [Microthrixaceae bacterium]
MAPTEATRWLTADEQRTWRAWLGINALLAATLDRQLQRDAAIPHAYYVTMAMLSEQPGRSCTMSELAAATRFSPSRLSHAVTKLEANGWIERRRAEGNARQIIATLTDEGMRVVEQVAPIHVEHVRTVLFDALNEEQATALGDVLEAILANLIELEDAPGDR